jgi:serine/threonine-protein kinase
MPEAMAMLKLKGFIHDLGGEVLESEPGRIRVRLPGPVPKPASGWLRWLGGAGTTALAEPGTDLELHMERPDPSQAGLLSVTLVLRAAGAPPTAAWRERGLRIARDLQAYLIGR